MENSLTTEPIPSLVKKIAIPSVVGFFFNTMYNVVDTYFGGKVSTEALASLSLSFLVFFLLISFSSGMAIGITALVTLLELEKRKKQKIMPSRLFLMELFYLFS